MFQWEKNIVQHGNSDSYEMMRIKVDFDRKSYKIFSRIHLNHKILHFWLLKWWTVAGLQRWESEKKGKEINRSCYS